jgi:hypothetical protein
MASPSPRYAPRAWLEDPLFRGQETALEALAAFDDWPSAADLDRALAPMIERALGRPMHFRSQRRVESLRYEASIVLQGEVPTRDGSAHDWLNALIWAAFPRAKFALHRRFHEAELTRQVPGRTRFQDRLALLDEGAVLRTTPTDPRGCIVFGHAILEHRIVNDNVARADLFDVPGTSSESTIAAIDEAFAAALDAWDDPPPARPPGIPMLQLFPEGHR